MFVVMFLNAKNLAPVLSDLTQTYCRMKSQEECQPSPKKNSLMLCFFTYILYTCMRIYHL